MTAVVAAGLVVLFIQFQCGNQEAVFPVALINPVCKISAERHCGTQSLLITALQI